MYVRLISYNFKFDEDTLLKYGFLLAWDKYGLLGNSKIVWTKQLKHIFSDRLKGKEYSPSDQFHIENCHNDFANLKVSLKKDRRKIGVYNLDEVTIDFIRNNKEYIVEWEIIGSAFKEIDFSFVKEFSDYLGKIKIPILSNPHVDWSDF